MNNMFKKNSTVVLHQNHHAPKKFIVVDVPSEEDQSKPFYILREIGEKSFFNTAIAKDHMEAGDFTEEENLPSRQLLLDTILQFASFSAIGKHMDWQTNTYNPQEDFFYLVAVGGANKMVTGIHVVKKFAAGLSSIVGQDEVVAVVADAAVMKYIVLN